MTATLDEAIGDEDEVISDEDRRAASAFFEDTADDEAESSSVPVLPETSAQATLLSTGWQVLGACRGSDPDMFFPECGASTRDAKEVCCRCTVREECLQYSLVNSEKFGIWGGFSERERRRLRRQRALAIRKGGTFTLPVMIAPKSTQTVVEIAPLKALAKAKAGKVREPLYTDSVVCVKVIALLREQGNIIVDPDGSLSAKVASLLGLPTQHRDQVERTLRLLDDEGVIFRNVEGKEIYAIGFETTVDETSSSMATAV